MAIAYAILCKHPIYLCIICIRNVKTRTNSHFSYIYVAVPYYSITPASYIHDVETNKPFTYRAWATMRNDHICIYTYKIKICEKDTYIPKTGQPTHSLAIYLSTHTYRRLSGIRTTHKAACLFARLTTVAGKLGIPHGNSFYISFSISHLVHCISYFHPLTYMYFFFF